MKKENNNTDVIEVVQNLTTPKSDSNNSKENINMLENNSKENNNTQLTKVVKKIDIPVNDVNNSRETDTTYVTEVIQNTDTPKNNSLDTSIYIALVFIILLVIIYFIKKKKYVPLISKENHKLADKEFLNSCIKGKDWEAIKGMVNDPSCDDEIKQKAKEILDTLQEL